MQAGADKDIVLPVEGEGYATGALITDIEGADGGALLGVGGAVEFDAINGAQGVFEALQQLAFMGQESLDAGVEELFDGGPQSGDSRGIDGARFKAIGEELGLLVGLGARARAPTDEGIHFLVAPRADVEAAGALGAEQGFVTRKGEEVDLVATDINGQAAGALGGVDQ